MRAALSRLQLKHLREREILLTEVMKTKDIRQLSVEDLVVRRRDLKQESFNLRIQQQSGQLEKPSRLREIRKEVARIETFITERRPLIA